MNELELQRKVSEYKQLFRTFESLLEYRRRLSLPDDRMAVDLCELYAIWGAWRVRRCIDSTCNFESITIPEENGNTFGVRERLPSYEAIHRATQDLLLAVAGKDKDSISGALKAMGVFSFCPTSEQVFPRMEDIASHVNGRAQQVFW